VAANLVGASAGDCVPVAQAIAMTAVSAARTTATNALEIFISKLLSGPEVDRGIKPIVVPALAGVHHYPGLDQWRLLALAAATFLLWEMLDSIEIRSRCQ